jgi:hypothetical protein
MIGVAGHPILLGGTGLATPLAQTLKNKNFDGNKFIVISINTWSKFSKKKKKKKT